MYVVKRIMKTRCFAFLSMISALMFPAFGCGRAPKQEPVTAPPSVPAEKGSLQTAVEGFTGKIAVDQGLKAKEQIKATSEKENRAIDEVMKP